MIDAGTNEQDFETQETWDSLQDLGFEADEAVLSERGPGLSLDLGLFKLTAGRMLNLRCVDVVVIDGFYASRDTMTSIDFEMPIRVESIRQCAAWIAWHLKNRLPKQVMEYLILKSGMVLLGTEQQDSLPWERRRAAFAARPSCMVERSWLRQAIRQIEKKLPEVQERAQIEIAFDGRVLTLSCENWTIPVPAEGKAWQSRFCILAVNLARLPPRLMREWLEVSVWEGKLTFGNWSYEGVSELVTGDASPSISSISAQPTNS